MCTLEDNIIRKSVWQYIRNMILLLIGITLAAFVYMNVSSKPAMLQPIIISLGYNVLISLLFIGIWKIVSQHSREYMVHLYLGGTGARLITAMLVVMTYCLLEEARPQRFIFATVFCTYYFAMLIYDTLFFIKTEGQQRKQNETH